LVTGGAGFIGSNLRPARARALGRSCGSGDVDALSLRAPATGRTSRTWSSCRADVPGRRTIRDPKAVQRGSPGGATPRGIKFAASRGWNASIDVDPGLRCVTDSTARFVPARGGEAKKKETGHFSASSRYRPTRLYGGSWTDRSRILPFLAAQPVPTRARPAGDRLRNRTRDLTALRVVWYHACSKNYGACTVPGEADSAVRPPRSRTRRCGLRQRQATCAMDPSRRHTATAIAGAVEGGGLCEGETFYHWRREERRV